MGNFYEAMLTRAENLEAMRLTIEEVYRFLDDFVAHADPIVPYFRTRPSIQDPDGEMFAELAINGQADALVSFNLDNYRSPISAPAHSGLPARRYSQEA